MFENKNTRRSSLKVEDVAAGIGVCENMLSVTKDICLESLKLFLEDCPKFARKPAKL